MALLATEIDICLALCFLLPWLAGSGSLAYLPLSHDTFYGFLSLSILEGGGDTTTHHQKDCYRKKLLQNPYANRRLFQPGSVHR